MKAKDLIKRLEVFFPEQEIGVEIHDEDSGKWYVADIKTTNVETHITETLKPSEVYVYGKIRRKHLLRGDGNNLDLKTLQTVLRLAKELPPLSSGQSVKDILIREITLMYKKETGIDLPKEEIYELPTLGKSFFDSGWDKCEKSYRERLLGLVDSIKYKKTYENDKSITPEFDKGALFGYNQSLSLIESFFNLNPQTLSESVTKTEKQVT